MRTTQHKIKLHGSKRQRGAVILLVTFSLIAFLGLAALVLDFGRLYIIESQLQNAADAGALRGAKDLNGTADQLDDACQRGVEGALTNNFLLVADALGPEDLTVEVSTKPFGASWLTLKTPGGSCTNGGAPAVNKYYYMRVTADASSVPSLLGGIIGVWENAAKALAVAGREEVEVTPLAICALDPNDCPPGSPTGTCGFQLGQSYDVGTVNAVKEGLNPGTLYWIDPVATTASCDYTSADAMRPFLCTGKIPLNVVTSPYVYTNTGNATGPSLGALDSRFGDYPPAGQCETGTAPSDKNIKQYLWTDVAVQGWTDQTLEQQSSFLKYQNAGSYCPKTGVVWAASTPDAAPIPAYSGTLCNDPPSYPQRTKKVGGTYPTSGTPYDQTGPPFYDEQTTPGVAVKPGRRLMNIIVVRCSALGPGVCRQTENLGIAEFLMLKKANTNNNIDLEFKQITPVGELPNRIVLYR